jgi:transcriptional regulator GlxA family with amidase domain
MKSFLYAVMAAVLTRVIAEPTEVEAPSSSTTPVTWPVVVPPSDAKKSRNIGIVLYRSYTMLDVFGPLNALQSVARIYPLNLYLLSHSMDPVTTEPFSAELNQPNSSFWFTVQPTHTFSNPPPDLDVLLVPGGWGWDEPDLQEHVDYIRSAYASLEYLITVCVGSVITARSGILDGRNATANKRFWSATEAHPAVNWVSTARWEVDGNIWSTSGVAAGIDGTLAWINHVYGTENATNIANGMEYEAHQDASWDPFADLYNLTSTNNLSRLMGL